MITHAVIIDGQRPAEQTRTETIRQVTMPAEIITKTITVEGDDTPLTAEISWRSRLVIRSAQNKWLPG